MLSKTIRILIYALISLALASCGSAEKNDNARGDPKKIDPDNRDSGSLFRNIKTTRPRGELYKPTPIKPLVLPDDLLNTSSIAVQQQVSSYDPESFRVLPKFNSARVANDANRQWLEVDSDVQNVWEAVMEYWAISGIDLVNNNPEAGLMETEWVKTNKEEDREASEAERLGKALLGVLTQRGEPLDRYRLRFERAGQDQTAVYVTHRSIARKEIVYGKKISEFEWVELPSNPEKVAEFLETLALLFTGGPASAS